MTRAFKLKHGFQFHDLLSSLGLERLDGEFLDFIGKDSPELRQELVRYRETRDAYTAPAISVLLISLASRLEAFLAHLFAIEKDVLELRKRLQQEAMVQAFKKSFVLRRARRYRGEIVLSFARLNSWLDQCVQKQRLEGGDKEAAVAELAKMWLQDGDKYAKEIDSLTQWCKLGLTDDEGRQYTEGWQSFSLPHQIDYHNLVPLQKVPGDPYDRLQMDPSNFRQRHGFRLTDPGMDLRQCEDQIHYCIYCHDHEGDFCSKGFPEKKADPTLGLKRGALGEYLTGCPLEQKISEMHQLRGQGMNVAALAVAMVDNPMIPVTGHRICNDCMKACIYQKQDPVDIPQTETRILTDVLALPWGVEIYDLLTRWNPLRQSQFCIKPYNGRNVLIVGMGPAGFTMAHHLSMEGCGVVGIDGLKIEPLPEDWLCSPILSYTEMTESLDERILMGFGGVAEYGITVRWDKNFLKLIYLSLVRRSHFQVFGGVRFGGTMDVEDAWRLGFDHLCIANGAGYPRTLNIANGLARGIRQASDFLMGLQLTGAAKADSLANLQVRLPAVVIGSGLTAIDTATEVQAYYIRQVEKIYHRWQLLTKSRGEDAMLKPLDQETRIILQEFLTHGRAVIAELDQAEQQSRQPDFIGLLRQWGGVTVVYRRRLGDSPAYRRNHAEIGKAMEEGIYYLEGCEPVEARLDEYGHVTALVCNKNYGAGEEVRQIVLPARAVFVAAGANPNTIYEREHPGHMNIQGNHFQPFVYKPGVHKPGFAPAPLSPHCKTHGFGPFTSYDKDNYKISFIGDAHPVFHGSVVKAVASAQRSYRQVLEVLNQVRRAPQSEDEFSRFQRQLDDSLRAVVEKVIPRSNVIELWVKAPMAARKFQAGQFFRLQTYESSSPVVAGTRLQIPLQTVSGAGIDGDKIRLFILRFGANARLAERFKPGQEIVLMGPNGAPFELPKNKTFLIIAGSWGAAVMLHLGPALRAAGNRVLYVAAYRSEEELYAKQELHAAADQLVWVSAMEPRIEAERPMDLSFIEKNIIKLLQHYGSSTAYDRHIRLAEVDEVLVMGSTGLLQALQTAFQAELKPLFAAGVNVVGTVGSPMQCMLKGVCAQCLQWQKDPETGRHTRMVFSCAMQDQPLACIDLDNLGARQKQNRLSEYLTGLWVDEVLKDN